MADKFNELSPEVKALKLIFKALEEIERDLIELRKQVDIIQKRQWKITLDNGQ